MHPSSILVVAAQGNRYRAGFSAGPTLVRPLPVSGAAVDRAAFPTRWSEDTGTGLAQAELARYGAGSTQTGLRCMPLNAQA